MPEANKEVKLSLKVMMNKQKSKVFFAEADNHFADILLSFLTLPLGRILKVLENHYGDKAPTIGSLSNLYRSLANLDNSHFVTKGAKKTLLNPTSSFEAEYDRLKLNITDSWPAKYFYYPNRYGSCSAYMCPGYDFQIKRCRSCRGDASSDGVFTLQETSFIISDNMRIFPNDKGLFGVITFLGITDMDEAEPITVDFGLTEIMKLLKASLTSSTPLSDVILNKTTRMKHSALVQSQPKIAKEENPNSRDNYLSLKVVIQKSTGKFLYAEAKEKFIDFLFGLLLIPLGGTEYFLEGKTCFKAINNLYRSTSQLIGCKYFKKAFTKERLMEINLHHHYFGPRSYLSGSRIYEVTDDLTVKPFCIASILSTLRQQKIPISDVQELDLQIGSKEGLSIMFASLISTSALSDALLTHTTNKRPRREV